MSLPLLGWAVSPLPLLGCPPSPWCWFALTKESDRLERVVRTKTAELHAACERAAVETKEVFLAQQEYNELKERIDRPMEETQESAPPPAPPAVSNPADVPVDSNDHDSVMDLNNPGIEEEDDGVAPSVKRKRLDHFDQMMAGFNHFDNEMLASFLGHVQAYSEQKNAIPHEVAVSSCGESQRSWVLSHLQERRFCAWCERYCRVRRQERQDF